MSEAPQARYEALRYSQTSGRKQTHLTFNIRGPGNSVLKLELPKTSLKGMVERETLITYLLSDHQNNTVSLCLVLRTRGLAGETVSLGGVFCRRHEKRLFQAFLTLEMQNSLARTKG